MDDQESDSEANTASGGDNTASGGDNIASGDEDVRDTLPGDLDVSALVGPYMFPNNSRRRVPGVLYLFIAACSIGAWALTRSSDPAIINSGFLWGGIALALFGCYSLIAGWNLEIDESEALLIASRSVGFPVGHASAQMGWRGWLSRPTWRILLYSNEPQPTTRGMVFIDGVDGEVIDEIVEPNPEDWSDLDLA
jgi:hypothetical protein